MRELAHARTCSRTNFWLACQVVLPILYFSIRLSQILRSGEDLRKTVGVNGLAGDAVAARSLTHSLPLARMSLSLSLTHTHTHTLSRRSALGEKRCGAGCKDQHFFRRVEQAWRPERARAFDEHIVLRLIYCTAAPSHYADRGSPAHSHARQHPV